VGTVKRLRISLGTLVAVEATSTSASAAEAAVEAAFAALTQISQRLHPQSADSDLARINNAPPRTCVTVHPSTCDLLNLARRLNTLTDGVFDPCLPSRAGRLQDIEVSTGRLFCRAPVALDFGGFAKGYAVDCAIAALASHGCTAGLVNAGGDLRVFGARTEPIFLRGPAGQLTRIELADAALAVSDADSQRRPAEHQGYYIRSPVAGEHLQRTIGAGIATRSNNIRAAGRGDRPPQGYAANARRGDLPPQGYAADARRGDPPQQGYTADARRGDIPPRRYAAVVAKEAVVSDALTKCVLLCPEPTARLVLKAFGATQPVNQ
jgi:thiamine biosynthesis lipoprotein